MRAWAASQGFESLEVACRKVVDAAVQLGVGVVGTFVGNDKDCPLRENLERFGFLLARNVLRPLIV
jgi:hypothetical protein